MALDVKNGSSMHLSMASDMAMIHATIQRVKVFIQECRVDDQFRIPVILRELLANAIIHGNQNVSSRTVHCWIEHIRQGKFSITVEDEGDGFDYSCLDTSLPEDPATLKKRGYVLINRLCQRVEFNPRGNQVRVLIQLPEACFEGKNEQGESAMECNGNMSLCENREDSAITVNLLEPVFAADDLEQVLLSYAEMCYSVSLALTHNPANARDLTENILLWAWHFFRAPHSREHLKSKILTELRARFMCMYRPEAVKDNSMRALCTLGLQNLGETSAMVSR